MPLLLSAWRLANAFGCALAWAPEAVGLPVMSRFLNESTSMGALAPTLPSPDAIFPRSFCVGGCLDSAVVVEVLLKGFKRVPVRVGSRVIGCRCALSTVDSSSLLSSRAKGSSEPPSSDEEESSFV